MSAAAPAGITAGELKARLGRAGELALLDLREQGRFSGSHLFHARSLPLSRLELEIATLVPRRETPIVLIDGGGEEDLAARGAECLSRLGYQAVEVLDGGLAAWEQAGYELFSGINVPSKAFGEFVEVSYGTPHLEAEAVRRLIDQGANMVILDSRPFEEYHRMSIPGGIDTPGGELVYRVHDLAPDPETLVVVNCAGRTRSIIGAQSLVNAGIPNEVAALKDGTMGWHLAGLALEYGQERVAPDPSEEGLARARAAAARVAERFGVTRISPADLAAWQSEREARTLYLLDVRSPAEFEAGHLPGSRSAPGGQLVQATDEYIGVLGARIVLIDDTGVRATMAASWLVQMGWREVAVLEGGLEGPLELGAPPLPALASGAEAPRTAPAALQALQSSGQVVLLLDLSSSPSYRKGHVPGAAWTTRARLGDLDRDLVNVEQLVLTAEETALADLAAQDLRARHPGLAVSVLDGGLAAWRAAGYGVEEGMTRPLSEADDVWYKPYENKSAVEQEMRNYLTWEIALVEQLERDGDAGFRRFD